MHSRIIQVSRKPIQEKDYFTEERYYDHWFTYQIADYVSGDVNREEDIKWLKGTSAGIVVDRDEHGHYLMICDKKKHFKDKFTEFERVISELKGISLDEFINSIEYKTFMLRNSYEDRYGFYIDEDDDSLSSLDSFVRNGEINVKYYIGGVVDYHF